MRVALTVEISGARDGVNWPARGVAFDLPDGEGAELVAGGLAVEVSGKPAAEVASAPKPEVSVATKAETRTKKG